MLIFCRFGDRRGGYDQERGKYLLPNYKPYITVYGKTVLR